jgi:hypothetical protein
MWIEVARDSTVIYLTLFLDDLGLILSELRSYGIPRRYDLPNLG